MLALGCLTIGGDLPAALRGLDGVAVAAPGTCGCRLIAAAHEAINRVRRIAERQGLRIAKSRRRDQLARDYGLFWVVDPEGPKVNDPDWPFDGRPAHGFPWSGADLDEVEQFLKTRPEDR